MIIGAGRCNDIDLRRLVASAENVLLLDVDMEAMHEAVMALPEDIRHRWNVVWHPLPGSMRMT
jgi:hypothetical protein